MIKYGSNMAHRINYDKITLTDALGRNHVIVIVIHTKIFICHSWDKFLQ